MQETRVRFLGWEDPLEKEMATHSSILARRTPWREKSGRLQSIGLQELDTTYLLNHHQCCPCLEGWNFSPTSRRPGFDPWVGKIPWRRGWLRTPVSWPGEFHGLYSSWGHKELDMTE